MTDPRPASGFSAGAAKISITPADLTGLNPMGRSFRSVRDSIFVRALFVTDGDESCVLVAADLIEVGDTKDIRARIGAELDVPPANILIAPSHTHNAPRIGLVPPGGKARVPSSESLVYTESVYDAMVAAVREARAAARPAMVGVGRGVVDVNINREQYVDGRWVHGYNPAGPTDKTLAVVRFASASDETIAVLMNYAVHSTVTLGTDELSGDLAGAAADYAETVLGGAAVAVWTSGALGDQGPRVSLDELPDPSERDRDMAHEAARAQGMLVGATALRTAALIERYTRSAVVSGAERVLACPVRRLEVPPGMEQAEVDMVELTLSCIMIGTIAIMGVSGEVTIPNYRALLEASPLADTLLISNANARIGYLPADEDFDRQTPAVQGCPIVQGHVRSSIVDGLTEMITAAVTR
ncbi:MAG TPA: neutral/alkaline non-lysosomal ceramidase N-terminal domain-containing protein [Trebonia sp.]|nr:neutral/alkaline non-lysosomal ceramidase N-terminal domain-containing protein [Trebonia sp.]